MIRHGYVKFQELSEDSKKFVNEYSSLHEFCTLSEEDQYSGIRELLEHLLIIDPKKRWDAQTALQESTFLQETIHTTTSSSN